MNNTYEATTGRLASANNRAGATVFNDHGYTYTARGNIASVVETGEIARTRNYTYDELERLTNVAAPGRPSDDENYTLDEEGNRTVSHLSAAHVTDPANRLLEDDSYTYVYDPNGNLIEKNAKLAPLSSWDYAYDALDQQVGWVSRRRNPPFVFCAKAGIAPLDPPYAAEPPF